MAEPVFVNEKPAWKSLGFVSGAVGVAVSIAKMLGYDLGDPQALTQAIMAFFNALEGLDLALLITSITGIIGRWKAVSRLKFW